MFLAEGKPHVSGSPRTLHGSLEIITIQTNDDFNDFVNDCAVAGRV
jgi:hypothetical protein